MASRRPRLHGKGFVSFVVFVANSDSQTNDDKEYTMYNPNSPRRLRHLNARQRKKLRVGEFTELGFSLLATLQAGLDEAAKDGFLTAWLEEVDRHRISFGGHFDGQSRLEGVVFPVQRGSISAELRDTLITWLNARAEVTELQADELSDLWHSQW